MRIIFTAILLTLAGFSAHAQKGTDLTPTALKMVLVNGGHFQMGSVDGLKNEQPVHAVGLKNFYIAKYEVTQTLWARVMGNRPSHFKGCDSCPVEEVSPEEIQMFLTMLNQLTGKKYRLPTEAEWEYAALGGDKSKGYKYSGSDSLGEVAWFEDNSEKKSHPVGQKKPNELGLYDMSGNVWELCADWFNANYYKKSSSSNPLNNEKAAHRVVRGGSWRSPKERCYSKARNRNISDHHKQNGGFRLALDE